MPKDYEEIADCDDTRMEKMMEDVREVQEILEHSGFYTIDTKICQAALGLGLLDLGLDHLRKELSGGQRTKVLLAKLLLENPMILDEPTNFLDEEYIAWLKQFLLDFEHVFIPVFHDIAFMNDVVNVIYPVQNVELNRYSGDYNNYLRMVEIKEINNKLPTLNKKSN